MVLKPSGAGVEDRALPSGSASWVDRHRDP